MKKSNQKIIYTINVILIAVILPSCLRPFDAYKEKENYKKGEITKATDITDDASSYAHTVGVGINRTTQVGYDMSYLFENKSRVDLSANYNLGKANNSRGIGDDAVNHTEKRFTEAVSVSLDFAYPIIKSTKTKKGAIPITDGRAPNMSAQYSPSTSGSGGPGLLVPDSVFFVIHNFKQIRAYNLSVGMDHFYSSFGSEFYKRYLNSSNPDGSFRFPDAFDHVTINQGTYYLKLGGSMNLYTNTNIDATLYGTEFKGSVVRELRFNAALNYGLLSTVSDLNLAYASFENGEFVDKVDLVNPLDYDLQYAAFGGQASFSWTQYFFSSFVMKYTAFVGMSPGYYNRGSDNLVIGASLRVGLGKMR